MKKILMIVNYFYPDLASTGQLMTELCEEIQNEFELTVVAAFPNYTGNIPEKYKGKFIVKEKYQNVNILRVRVPEFDKTKKISRLKYIVSYFINVIFAMIISGKQDLIFTISQPPILGGLLGVIGKTIKRAKLIYNIQDFNPEQIEAVGYSKNKFMIELTRKIDNFSCKAADRVVIVGQDMRETLGKRFKNKKIPDHVVINNWIDEKNIYSLEEDHPKVLEFKRKYDLKDRFVLMYSGNIGLYYDLDNIIEVIGRFKSNPEVIFAFVGEGAVKPILINYCDKENIKNVRFIPYQKKEDLVYSLNAADVHIVTNAKGIKGVSVPSKIYGVMAVEKPILGILEEGSEARRLIEQSGCGDCCEPGEYMEIEKTMNKYIEQKKVLKDKGAKGRAYLETYYTKEQSIDKYKDLFKIIE